MISQNFKRNNENTAEQEKLINLCVRFERRRDAGAYDRDLRMRLMCDHFLENAREKIRQLSP